MQGPIPQSSPPRSGVLRMRQIAQESLAISGGVVRNIGKFDMEVMDTARLEIDAAWESALPGACRARQRGGGAAAGKSTAPWVVAAERGVRNTLVRTGQREVATARAVRRSQH